MHYLVEVKGVQKDADGATVLTLSVPDQAVKTIRQQAVKKVELRIDDGRIISGQQRRKIYATLRDIAEYTGYTDEAMKESMSICFIPEMRISRFRVVAWKQPDYLSMCLWSMP